jgi:RNA polymerase sigma factor (sigma-70 family)
MSARISTRLLAAQSDQRLVELSQQGHERAFELLVKRYRKPLQRYCARMGLSPSRAEDVVQQTLLQAWLAIQRGVAVRELRPWLYRIAHNTAINAMRRPETVQPLTEALQVGAAAGEQPEHVIAMRSALTDVAGLPQMQRDAILLSAVDGRSHEEVASHLGISEGAVRGLLYRARATLRAAAAGLMPTPLLGWAERTAHGGGTAGVPEITAAGGAAGAGAVLLKGAAIAVSTAALVAGAAVKLHGGGDSTTHRHAGSAAVAGKPAAAAPQAARPLALVTVAKRSTAGGGAPAAGAPGTAALPAHKVVASVGPSGTSFSSGGGGSTRSPGERSTGKPSEPSSSTTVTSAPSATVKAAAVQAPSGGGAPEGTPAGTTAPPPTTTTPPKEAAPPPPEKPTPELGGEKPPAGGQPEKEPGDLPGTGKEPAGGEKPAGKDE